MDKEVKKDEKIDLTPNMKAVLELRHLRQQLQVLKNEAEEASVEYYHKEQ